VKVKVISTAEVDCLLFRYLGPMQNWTHYLDCCRCDPDYNFHELRLVPIAKTQDGRNSWRPRYLIKAVVEFIKAVREIEGVTDPVPIKPITVDVDPHDFRIWQLRKLTPVAA